MRPFGLQLRGQVILTLVGLLALSLLVIFLVVRGLNRSAHEERERAALLRAVAIVASLARELSDEELARDRFVAQVGECASVRKVLLLDEALDVLAPVGERPLWPPEEVATLRMMMARGEPAYRYPRGEDGGLWILAPVSAALGTAPARVRALAIHFLDRGKPGQRVATEQLLLLFLGLIVALMALGGYLALTRLVIRPVRRLIHTVDRVGEPGLADLDVHARPRGGNELAALSDAVDRMLARLQSDKLRIDESLDRQRELNQQLVLAQEVLLRSEKLASVGQLAAGVAHEIGNPVSIILGYLEILRRSEVCPEERASYLADMTEATERISGIIRDLLDFSRPVQDEDDGADLDRAIASTRKLLRPQKRFREVVVEGPAAPTRLRVHMSEGRLQQILVNLLMNAADAMQGRGRVEIRVEDRGEKVGLIVADEGPGIPPEAQRRVFDPFYTTKEPGEGTGLGLAICHSLVQAFGGEISLDSEEGRGATFTIELWKAGQEPDTSEGP